MLVEEASLERLYEEDDFTVDVAGSFDLIEKAGEDIEETRPIGGWCSTEDLDRQDEIVVAKGLDFSEFVSFGYFNDNHKQDTSAVLGYPKFAHLKNNRWYTEGNLLKGYPPADRVWELAKALRKSRAPRRLGFSIEGKVLERDGRNKIVRAKVRNVAITSAPVNTACTWDVLAKAYSTPARVAAAAEKALSAGYGLRLTAGAALRAETLDTDDEGTKRNEKLSFDEAVDRLKRLRPNYKKSVCERIARLAMAR